MASRLSGPLYCIKCKLLFRVETEKLSILKCVVSCPSGMHQAIATQRDGGALELSPQTPEKVIVRYPSPILTNPIALLTAFIGLFATFLTGYAAIALVVHPLLCPLVFGCTLISIALVGIFGLGLAGVLSEKTIAEMFGALGEWLGYSFGVSKGSRGSIRVSDP